MNPTILMVTHDRNEAAVVAEKIALFNGGRMLQHDRVDLMYSRPSSLEASRLMGGANEIPGTVWNGGHRSALGVLPLPRDNAWQNGPGILLARQESIEVRAADGTGLQATISGLQSLGPRRLVTLDAAGVVLRAEVPWGRGLAIGENVKVHVPTSALAVVADPDAARPGRHADEGPAFPSHEPAALAAVDH